jgi:hypothetical protein
VGDRTAFASQREVPLHSGAPRWESSNAEFDHIIVITVDLDEAGLFVLLDRQVGWMPSPTPSNAVFSEITSAKAGEARVTVAMPIEGSLAAGLLYTRPPMGEQGVSRCRLR